MSKKAWRQNQAAEDVRELMDILDDANDTEDENWNPSIDEIMEMEAEEDERFAIEYPESVK